MGFANKILPFVPALSLSLTLSFYNTEERIVAESQINIRNFMLFSQNTL